MCLQFTRVHVFLFRPKKITLASGNAGDEKTFAWQPQIIFLINLTEFY